MCEVAIHHVLSIKTTRTETEKPRTVKVRQAYRHEHTPRHHCFGEHHQDSSRRVLGSLNEAMKIYDSLAGYEAEDVLLDGAVIDTHEEVAKLPQLHSNLCAVFKEVSNCTPSAPVGYWR